MKEFNERDLVAYLTSFLTPERSVLFEEKISQRTRFLTVVLEDIFQPHNASAVVRSCECFGIQDVHVIENHYEYRLSENVAMGSSKWLNLFRYNEEQNNSKNCLHYLAGQGYRIVATTPDPRGYTIHDLPLDKPISLWFGTEKDGLSSMVLENADTLVSIPMYGFTKSLNVSVSAAICLQALTSRLRSEHVAWQLTEAQKTEVLLGWVRRALKRPDLLEMDFLHRLRSEI